MLLPVKNQHTVGLVADVTWARFQVDASNPAVAVLSRPVEYELRGQVEVRRELTRDVLDVTEGDRAVRFIEKWGPADLYGWEAESYGEPVEVDDATGYVRAESIPWVTETSARLRHALALGSSADEEDRSVAESWLMLRVRQMGLGFGPADSLVPQLVPFSLVQIAVATVLEEVRGVGPALQCRNYPSSGCRREVPVRNGDRGRRPLYCSKQCAMRAQSRRAYTKRKAGSPS
jgi:hypothetical protein